jgi:vancomycin aglycone glucosyltransferase
MVALGQRMQAAGHDVTLAVAENFRGLVEGVGLPYVRAGGDVETMTRATTAQAATPLLYPFALVDVIRRLIDEQFDVLTDLCEGADVLVGSLLLVTGPSLGERCQIPVCLTSYFPGGMPCDELPSPFLSRAGGPVWFNRASWAFQRVFLNFAVRETLNRHRERLGLAGVSDVTHHMHDVAKGILATDPEIAPVPAEWKSHFDATGFWFLDSAEPLPAELDVFLDAGDPPVYVGFGSMPNVDPATQTEVIRAACGAMGRRAIVSAGWGGLGRGATSEGLLSIGPVNHRLLFERVAAVVHHGGAGTLAAAARAGVPQVVVPHFFDQFYWGSRVEALGLGPPPLPRDFGPGELVSALRVALDDAPTRQRAVAMGKRLRLYSGTDRAIAAIEKVVTG